jgi:acetyl-CoA carboxylase/biotin carboxylase 1
MMDYVELIPFEETLIEMKRLPGENDVGMIAWRLTLYTPEYPDGRDVILIANDLTYCIGSFGPKEDLVFYRASKMARQLGIPRIYFAANSGARIGLSEEVSCPGIRTRVQAQARNDIGKRNLTPASWSAARRLKVFSG